MAGIRISDLRALEADWSGRLATMPTMITGIEHTANRIDLVFSHVTVEPLDLKHVGTV
jgi:hypothetical protein